MIRLDMSAEPRWLDLAPGLRVCVAPCSSAIVARARSSERIEALVLAGASEAELAVALAQEIGAMTILEWEGVGDAAGEPLSVTPEAVVALLDIWPVFEAFQMQHVAAGLLLDAEKNASAPSPTGTSEGAKPTAKRARASAKPVRRA